MTIKNLLVTAALAAVPGTALPEGVDWKFRFGVPDTEDRSLRFKFGLPPTGVAFRFGFRSDTYSARQGYPGYGGSYGSTYRVSGIAAEYFGRFSTNTAVQFGQYFLGSADLEIRDGFRFNFRKEAQPDAVPGYEDVAFRFLFGDPLFVAETAPAPLAFRFLFGGDAYDVDPDPLPFNTSPLSRYRPFVYEKTVIGRPTDDRMGYLVLGETYIGAVE